MSNVHIELKAKIHDLRNATTGEFERRAVVVTASVVGVGGRGSIGTSIGQGVNPTKGELGALALEAIGKLSAEALAHLITY